MLNLLEDWHNVGVAIAVAIRRSPGGVAPRLANGSRFSRLLKPARNRIAVEAWHTIC